MIKKLMHDKKGALFVFTLFMLLFVLAVGMIAAETMRIHGIQEHLSDELYRASNLAIKTAMHDSWRQDHISKFDEAIAIEAFYDYLCDDLDLSVDLVKYQDDQRVYMLTINEINVDGDNVRMNVKAVAEAPLSFKLLNKNWEIPVEVTSRNMRID